ncbi:sulfatase family protein [Paludisphaera rhizosphaerae]|uniref:sulfatase family protein n=1 Tax=Paludisphaera rhizosphaerae TaxID=2711216 RepID=UPI0013EADD7E|nr:sulfatase [Paludisphaera rhizosphaerae]
MTRTRAAQTLRILMGVFLAAAVAEARAEATRPNFLVIITDDQKSDVVGLEQREQGTSARFPWLRTPNMDRIAAEGVRFKNAFVTLSLCAPSRAAIMSGRYNHVNGVVDNKTPFPDLPDSLQRSLQTAGYSTAYFGKWHMGRQSGKRPGFDRSVSYIGQGVFMDCPVEIDGVATPTKGWVDDVVTDYALEHLDQRPQDKPFLMIIGYKSAHGPRTPPERHRETYAGQPVGPVHDEGVPAPYAATFRRADANAGDDVQPKAATKKAATKKAAAPKAATKKAAGGAGQGEGPLAYLRTLQGVDDNVGRLLKALDDKKLADDTMVVFMSDNGYYLGEHHLGDKRSAYDESLRIPFYVRWPGFGASRRGAVVDQMILNIDLAPTILDLAGAPIPAAMQGRSWRALAEGREPKEPWRKAFFYEYYYESPYAIPTVFALRTDTAKLIVYPGHPDWEELFDLTADPRETRNLIHDESARALRDDLRRQFDAQAQALGARIPAGDKDGPKP